MKKAIWLLMVAGIAFWFDPATSSDVTRDVALLFKARGKVEFFDAVKNRWRNARRGLRLNSGDMIRTGDESLAAVVFTDDKSLMKIRSRSDVVIRGERRKSSIAKRVYMEVGEVFVHAERQKAEFRLETPTGVAAVKGTEFYGIVDESGNMFIVAIKGLVELMNKYGSVMVGAGETGKSDGKSPPKKEKTDPKKAPNWAQEGQEEQLDELEIQFKTPDGELKTLKIRTKSKE